MNRQSDRLIVALDTPTVIDAAILVRTLGTTVSHYKIGLELLMTGDFFNIIKYLKDSGKTVFADIKFYDIPTTVERAVDNLVEHGVDFTTVHTGKNDIISCACNAAAGTDTKILAVTMLSTYSDSDMDGYGTDRSLSDVMLSRARQARLAGADGVVISGNIVKDVCTTLSPIDNFEIVVPGIRFPNNEYYDQKQVLSPESAFLAGATRIVVGRPIRDANDPKGVAERIQNMISQKFF
jgi:orotidine-5'-phosphate decarboxylase